MLENKPKRPGVAYLVTAILFIVAYAFNDFISIAGIRPDILLIFLIFLSLNEKPFIALTAAFVFGFIQDILLPGYVQYWGLLPLFKTLVIYGFLKLLPYVLRLKGFAFMASLFLVILIYNTFYNLLYFSGYVKPFIAFYRYTLPETLYTFLILLVLNMIFPLKNKSR